MVNRISHDHRTPLERHRRTGFTLVELAVVIAIILILIALLLPATRSARGPARRAHCKNNLKQIGLALHNYHHTYGSLPPTYTVDANGEPLHSWRTLILPFLEQQAIFDQIDLSKPWDDPANETARKTLLDVYQCPETSNGEDNHTTYLAVVAPNAAFQGPEPKSFADITDGPENTLVVIEVDSKHAVPWMAPFDADEAFFLAMSKEDTQPHNGGTQFTLADGRVQFLSAEASADLRRALITIDANDEVAFD